jgi:hypothetical protein
MLKSMNLVNVDIHFQNLWNCLQLIGSCSSKISQTQSFKIKAQNGFHFTYISLQDTRGKLYALLSNCIPPDVIIKKLTFEFLKNIDSQLKPSIVGFAAEYVMANSYS